jgi:hypothetical protein
VPKSKNALALLEVLRRGDVKAGGSDLSDSSPASSDRPPVPQAPASPGGRPQAQVRPDGDRLKFSVSTLTLAMALFVAVVILAGTFALGRHLGYDSGWQAAENQALLAADDEFREIREQPPSPGVLQDLDVVTQTVTQEHVRQQRAAHAGQVGFIDDLNYVWIETFANKSDATAAREFLNDNDIASVIIENGGKWVLVSKEGFDYRLPEEKAACQQLGVRIRDVGQQYLQAGGRYGFKCYAKKKVPGSTW